MAVCTGEGICIGPFVGGIGGPAGGGGGGGPLLGGGRGPLDCLEFGGIRGGCFGAVLTPPVFNIGALLSLVIVFLKPVPAWIELNRASLPPPEEEGED